MRKKEFYLNDKEEIVGLVYVPGQRIVVEVGAGNDVDGEFVVAPNQNYEQYVLDTSNGLEAFEANVQIMEMLELFKNFCWDFVVTPTRNEVESKRNTITLPEEKGIKNANS